MKNYNVTFFQISERQKASQISLFSLMKAHVLGHLQLIIFMLTTDLCLKFSSVENNF